MATIARERRTRGLRLRMGGASYRTGGEGGTRIADGGFGLAARPCKHGPALRWEAAGHDVRGIAAPTGAAGANRFGTATKMPAAVWRGRHRQKVGRERRVSPRSSVGR